jgi:RNA polymerase sigma-70 factor (ECF subfamily)
MAAERYSGPQRFPTTSWTLVGRAGGKDDLSGREALGRLLAQYIPALHAHLVHRKGLTPERAEDVVQDFVAGKVLERDLIAQADRELGRFRTFLLTALDRFFLNWIRDQGARKRAPGEAAEPLGERVESVAAGDEASAAFDVAWARSLLSEAIGRMRQQCESSNRPDVWGVFQSRVLAPIMDGTPAADYGELVERFGFRSPSQASNVLATAKRMFARMLRSVVADYARDAGEIEEEIRDLRTILARSGRRAVT